VVDIGVGGNRACALTATGEVWCWGTDALFPGTGYIVPQRAPWFTDATMLAVGGAHACALRDGGDVTCWGDNFTGAVGGTGPIVITAYATKVAAGSDTTCVLQYDAGVKCWGGRGGINVRGGTASTTPYLMPFRP
jgi:alpha-tubulin suppressor-like RCC1 family protein